MSGTGSLTSKAVRLVSPALEKYSEDTLLRDVWQRPDLSPRDRSIIILAALIARNQAIEMPTHFTFALDNGVKPSEISEIITHLAFYSGWGNAMSASAVATEVFCKRGITPDQTFGYVRPWRRTTGVWSRSARSSLQAKLRKLPITSTGRWITA